MLAGDWEGKMETLVTRMAVTHPTRFRSSLDYPHCNEEEAYYSTLACFMANRAFQTRSRVVWDPKWEV
jgi:hypothetical protein